MMKNQETEEQRFKQIKDKMEDDLTKGEEEQKWLKKECDNISEILIKRNFELKDL